MIRIEKTNFSISALISLSANLKKLQEDNIIEIAKDGKSATYRKKEEHEKNEEFKIDLTLLDDMFKAITGHYFEVVIDNEAEDYFKNCSYACYYYKTEEEELEEFNHFRIFHKIHCEKTKNQDSEENLIGLLLNLFRIEKNHSKPFLQIVKENINIDLEKNQAFNTAFEKLKIYNENNIIYLELLSGEIDNNKSIDCLYMIKEFLFAMGYNVDKIPSKQIFSIEADKKIQFTFSKENNVTIDITFSYTSFDVIISKAF